MNLQNWVSQARAHWKEFQPKRYAALEKSGKLEATLQEAAERTHQEMSAFEEQGFNNQEAWEMTRQRYLFPPEEGMKPAQDSPNWRPSLTEKMHEVMKTGARTIAIPQPLRRTKNGDIGV
jgi:hypothetical protein